MRSVPAHIERRTFRRHRQIRQLGYEDYSDYLRSPAWSDVKRRYRESDLPQMCGCGATSGLQMHHKTYERVGEERLEDLAPMCRDCHADLHVLEARGQIGLDFDPLRDDARAAAYAILERVRIERARREYHEAHGERDFKKRVRSLAKVLTEEAYQAQVGGVFTEIQPHLNAISAEIDAIAALK